jgi:hypothetical protein
MMEPATRRAWIHIKADVEGMSRRHSFASMMNSRCYCVPALAADEFYIVRDTTTKKCTVVDKKPTVTTTTIVGDGTVYKSRTEADTAVKTVKVCTEK